MSAVLAEWRVAVSTSKSTAVQPYKVATLPTVARDPAEIIGFGGMDGDGRKKLALSETPFFITNAECKFFPDGREAAIFHMVIYPDADHNTPWETHTMVGLPKEPDPDAPGERQRIVDHFQSGPADAIGPMIATMVDVGQPSPYWALRKAPDRVLAQYAVSQ